MFDVPSTMMAVVTMGCGGYDKLTYQRVPTPTPRTGEVLIRVLAAGINNTDINTRLGWYASSIDGATNTSLAVKSLEDEAIPGGWAGATLFPLIQGTDCCGKVVVVGSVCDSHLLGARVLVRSCMRTNGFRSLESVWMALDFDGAFAQYVTVPASEVFPVACNWTDAELATIPCAYGTVENMLIRGGCSSGQHVLITGASGGVGSATIQLAKRRGAYVTAITSESKAESVRAIGADQIVTRENDIQAQLNEASVDLVVDNVGGSDFPKLLNLLSRGGKYATSGAIAGPIVSLDMRDLHLKDITLLGSTAWDEPVFSNLASYIEADEIRPLLAQTFPLHNIELAQVTFSQKKHVGNFVLLPTSER
ncbi:alcohol dehydrogenase family protein [Litorivicinus sp.]|nr:alcohol dehydrogenase family protein [Litorivicinus sp.]